MPAPGVDGGRSEPVELASALWDELLAPPPVKKMALSWWSPSCAAGVTGAGACAASFGDDAAEFLRDRRPTMRFQGEGDGGGDADRGLASGGVDDGGWGDGEPCGLRCGSSVAIAGESAALRRAQARQTEK